MNAFVLFLMLAVIVEGLVEYGKTLVECKDRRCVVLQLSALAVSILLCVLSGADIFSALGFSFELPFMGKVLTGIFASRGANYASDFLGKLQKEKPAS